ncbi:hypothetical protein DY000_02029681 [Brassica cretica]|uniref:Gnk2-homologous domain-containing protein n=1 Tax=Brassica cretica TaxID=69181 RepID=A0ABQ7DTZ3_BRACR|nr:hypothetical protein DY000_02029681 [Brassica cretica]
MDFFSELTLKVKKNTEAGSIIILYAAGEKKLGKNTLYAMVQCVSLTIDCKSCLAWSITKLFKNGDIREGGRVLGMNCDETFEIPSQAELINRAFAGDDVLDEFDKAKEEVLNQEVPKPEKPVLLPAWGDWIYIQRETAKLYTTTLQFPHKSKELFEHSMRMPTSRV